MAGFPVVLSERGAPFVAVEKGAPLATVAENGRGLPIRVVEKGAPPLVIHGLWSPADLFENGEFGTWYDPSFLDTLFQNANGTTPAVPGSPVGLVLDARKEMGPELLPNPDFTNDLTGWAPRGGSANSSIEMEGGRAKVTVLGAGGGIQSSLVPMIIGRTYLFSALVEGGTFNGVVSLAAGPGTNNISTFNLTPGSEPQLVSGYFTATSTSFRLEVARGTATTGTFFLNSASIREVLNPPLSQPTTAARPILSRMPLTGRRNLLTHTDLRGAAWAPSSSPDTVISPDAPDGFSKVSFTAPSTDRRFPSVQSLQASIPQGVRVTVRALFRPLAGCTTIALGASSGSNRWSHAAYNIVTGESTIYTVSTAGIAEFKSAEEVSPGLWELVVTITAGAAAIAGIYAHFGTGDATDLRLNSPIASCEIGEISLENGDTFNGYQRVTNAYDVTEAGVPDTYSLVYDLADDALTTTLPQAINGDILIAGTKGSIIEPVSYAAGSTFAVGPDTSTGGTPGILRAIGDIVGVLLIDRTLTQTERDVLIEHYKGKGAKGLLVPGPELVVNGTFDTDLTGWTDFSGEWFWNDGAAVIDNASGPTAYLRQGGLGITSGGAYQVEVDTTGSTVPFVEVRMGASASGGGIAQLTKKGVNSVALSWTGVGTELLIRSSSGGAGGVALLNSVSVRELRPQEDW